ncbi:hypothetical protein IC762_01825 [Bradyrhizobium genosp. L]|uniref:hypothetical protein n=1 Tax=Bradyrhizobium genosp. L TaxID=83637 RepID=UPI0018A2C33E|nr:hypothetical protein [Bradyrhizobium genosp. L]QPF85099.1 hypothetical protein IC762_01825 [Bradyrhizobium genosp. L]
MFTTIAVSDTISHPIPDRLQDVLPLALLRPASTYLGPAQRALHADASAVHWATQDPDKPQFVEQE